MSMANSQSLVSGLTQRIPFSSGNPRIEETRGIVHLYPEDPMASRLPIGRKPLVYVLDVPNHLTYADFCQFCGSFIQHVLEMRVTRNDGDEDHYGVLMKFSSQISADEFYSHFNRSRFSSLEEGVCHMLYAIDVQFTGSIEHAQSSNVSTEQATCPVCLERLDQDTGGILTTICNHSFHCSCISNWTDSSCPVCRYCQQQPEKSTCTVCETTENLWMCVTCGFVGCGRYRGGHAIKHWKETQHCYSLEIETQRVWDYAGDNYVHRLIQSKTDEKLVEFDCTHAAGTCEFCDGLVDQGVNEALLNSKLETIFEEYNKLLTTQLDNQRRYYESILLEVRQETEREAEEAINRALSQRLHKAQARLEKYKREKIFLDEINESLMKNQEAWKVRIQEAEERAELAIGSRDRRIHELEEQLVGLMARVEAASSELNVDVVDQRTGISSSLQGGGSGGGKQTLTIS
ncbi:zinc finger (C3HC4-type RING finger) family protein [Wolffia australiana]